jgi:hypothetical protein
MKLTIAIVTGVLIVYGCSRGPDEAASVEVARGDSRVEGKDACELMTLADVQEIYAQPMMKSDRNLGVSGPSANVATCTYQNESALLVATLMATWSKTAEGPLASRDAYALSAERDVPPELRKDLAVEKVDFQGLPALWQAGQLKVFKAGTMLSILADPAAGKDARQTIEALMAKAVGRI